MAKEIIFKVGVDVNEKDALNDLQKLEQAFAPEIRTGIR
jgi:hypothetical protein